MPKLTKLQREHNQERANRAAEPIEDYKSGITREDAAICLRDVLADLMHFAKSNRLNFEDEIAAARKLLTAEDRAKLGTAGQVVLLRNTLGALMSNILPPTAAELKDAQPGSLAYNWKQAQELLRGVHTTEPPSDEPIALHELHLVLQEELDALRIWRAAEPMNADVLEGIDISISKIGSMLHEATALLKSIPTSEPPPGEFRGEATTTTADVLKALISTVQATGGLVHFPDGTYGCAGDEEWLDLADVTRAAKQTLEDGTGVVMELTITEIPEQT